MSLLSGRDCFTPDAGEWESKDCPTCGLPMMVTRGCKGPRGFAANLAKRLADDTTKYDSEYDFFQCAFAGNIPHKQARDLMILAKDTPSPTLSKIYLMDAEKVLQEAKFSYNGGNSPS